MRAFTKRLEQQELQKLQQRFTPLLEAGNVPFHVCSISARHKCHDLVPMSFVPVCLEELFMAQFMGATWSLLLLSVCDKYPLFHSVVDQC